MGSKVLAAVLMEISLPILRQMWSIIHRYLFFGSFFYEDTSSLFFQCLEVNWLKVAPRLPPPFILIWWLYTKARKAIRTINGHQFQLHIHLSAISLLLLRSSYLRICELGNASFSLHLITLVIFHVLINKLALVLFSFTSSSIMIWKGETRLINL